MKRVLFLIVCLALTACAPQPQLTLIPVETLAAQTLAAMSQPDTPIPPPPDTPAPDIPPTEEATPSPDVLAMVPGAECVPTGTAHTRGLVTRVIDGSTIEVAIGNDTHRVKYIGVKAPEVTEWQGPQALAANESMISGQFVTLINEVSEADPEGALLRHVILDGKFVNYEMVRLGFAAVLSVPPDVACEGSFLQAQSQAQAASLGMWAPTPMPSPTRTTTPTITPIPTATSPAPCNCEGPRLTCNDFPNQASAQTCFEYCRDEGYGDVFDIDKNENGRACEGLP